MSFEPSRVREDFTDWRYLHWNRFVFDINPYNLWYNLENPYDLSGKKRTARQDITHSYVNLFVEGVRSSSYLVGHGLAVLFPFAVLALIGAVL